MSERFHISDVNPNDSTGGGGCLCSEIENADCEGPFTVFFHTETESVVSPHAVVCAPCIRAAAKAIEGETMQIGEPDPVIDVEAEEIPAEIEI